MDLHADGGRAVGVGGRRVAGGAVGSHGCLSGEQCVVVVGDDEVHRLGRLVGRAGGDGGGPRRHGLGAGVLGNRLVGALGEAGGVVHRSDGDGEGLDSAGVDAAVGGAAAVMGLHADGGRAVGVGV